MCVTPVINHVFVSFSAFQIYDLSYIHNSVVGELFSEGYGWGLITNAHHMTKSNIWISGELLDQWMIVGGEECATFDLLWQLSHHSTSDGCAVICSCTSTQLVYKNEWMSCGMAENRASLAELYKECTLTWNMKEQKKIRVIFCSAATPTWPPVKLINGNVNREQ